MLVEGLLPPALRQIGDSDPHLTDRVTEVGGLTQ